MELNSSILEQRVGALYVRVSTDEQTELSPDTQINLGLEYAKKNNIFIPKENIFRDDGISGKKADKRPGFKALIELALSKEHPIDCILVWEFSRFARNQEESIIYKYMLSREKVDVISISQPLPDNPYSSLNERIIEWFDENYLTHLATEVTRGMTENAKRGNYQTAPGIGYRSPGYRQVPVKDPDTFPILEYIDRWFMDELLTTRQIAVKLNAMGYKTKRNNLFDARGVEYILRNPFNAGKVHWKDIMVDGRHEAAWTWEHHLEIQKRLNELAAANAGHGRRKRDVSTCHHWLTGLLVCSTCGKTLANCGSKNGHGFQCWTYGKGLCNDSHFITQSLAEKYVISGLEQLLASDMIYYEIVQSTPATDAKEKELIRILSRLEEREKRAKEAYLNEIDTLDEYKESKFQINAERVRIMNELNTLTSSRETTSKQEDDKCMIERVEEVLNILKNPDADYTKKGLAIRGIVDRIVFDRQNTIFDFHLKLVK